MKFLNHLYNYLITGPSGTGKTAFTAYYIQEHYDKIGNTGYWLTFPSIFQELKRLLPGYIVPTTDIFDPRFANPRKGFPRTYVVGDEFDRLLNKNKHYSDASHIFTDLIALHRQKNFDFIASDQTFDFLKGVRERAHWIGFTGLSDTIYHSLKNNLSRSMIYWIDKFQHHIVKLGEKNRQTLKNKGFGRIVMTNGSENYVVKFKRPSWYTLELSHIWKYVTVDDLKKDQRIEEQFDDYDLESERHKILMLSYHIADNLFKGKITKEKISAAYIQASSAINDNPSKLPGNGRGYPQLILSTHALGCFWCDNQEEYRKAMKSIIDSSKKSKKGIEKETKEVEKELKQYLNI